MKRADEPNPDGLRQACSRGACAGETAEARSVVDQLPVLAYGWSVAPLLLAFAGTLLQPLLGLEEASGPPTTKQLAEVTHYRPGPVALVLRAAAALRLVRRGAGRGTWSAERGQTLDEVAAVLGPGSAVAEGLWQIYRQSPAPFRIPSSSAKCCLRAWEKFRARWAGWGNRLLALMLDAVILVPMLTSIAYRSQSELKAPAGSPGRGIEGGFCRLALDASVQPLLQVLLQELEFGTLLDEGPILMVQTSVLEQCKSLFVPASASLSLGRFPEVLAGTATHREVLQDEADAQLHVAFVMRMAGYTAACRRRSKNLLRVVCAFLENAALRTRTQSVVALACRDDHLMTEIQREALAWKHPLAMIGIPADTESREQVADPVHATQGAQVMIYGADFSNPPELITKLAENGVDVSSTLFVHDCVDFPFTYEAQSDLQQDGKAAFVSFAEAQLGDMVHLDANDQRLEPSHVLSSLVEYFDKWGAALEPSMGLCCLNLTGLDLLTARRTLLDPASLPCEAAECLARRDAVPALVLALAAAMAGLVPLNITDVGIRPHHEKYCCLLAQHLVRMPFKIRLAESSDISRLCELEGLAWVANMRATQEELLTRLVTSPTTNLVCTVGGRIVAVLYMQRIHDDAELDRHTIKNISAAHIPEGRLLQLIAIAADPRVEKGAIGSDLRTFALHLAHLDPTVEAVVAVTFARGFKGRGMGMQEYVDKHVEGVLTDTIIGFHTNYGARVQRLVHGFRPEDANNHGVGVLIRYDIQQMETIGPSSVVTVPRLEPEQMLEQHASTKECQEPVLAKHRLAAIVRELGYVVDDSNLTEGFLDYGIDSADAAQLRMHICTAFRDDTLPKTLLFDYPNIENLAHYMESRAGPAVKVASPPVDRGLGTGSAALGAAIAVDHEADDDEFRLNWRTLDAEGVEIVFQEWAKAFARPAFQRSLQPHRDRCGGDTLDRLRYMSAITTICEAAQGEVLKRLGLVEEAADQSSVDHAIADLQGLLVDFYLARPSLPRIYATFMELSYLPPWPASSRPAGRRRPTAASTGGETHRLTAAWARSGANTGRTHRVISAYAW